MLLDLGALVAGLAGSSLCQFDVTQAVDCQCVSKCCFVCERGCLSLSQCVVADASSSSVAVGLVTQVSSSPGDEIVSDDLWVVWS